MWPRSSSTTWVIMSTVRYMCVTGHLETVCEELLNEIWSKVSKECGFPVCSAANNPPANAGDMG